MTKAQFGQRLRIARTDVRYYSKHRRWMAMARSVALVLFCGWISETCQECGRRHHLLWHSPQPLWDELIGRPGGILCPRCFDARARCSGITLVWTPMVVCRDHVATTNHWHDPDASGRKLLPERCCAKLVPDDVTALNPG